MHSLQHDLGEAKDVVAQYCQRNHAPGLPSNASLLAVHDKQQAQHSCSVSRNGSVSKDKDQFDAPISASAQPQSANAPVSASTQPQSANASVSASAQPPSAVAPSVSTEVPQSFLSSNTNPLQLHFYPPAVRDIIKCAKQFSRCDLGSINAFPLRAQFNTKAADYVNEAITERHAWGLTIPTGRWQPVRK